MLNEILPNIDYLFGNDGEYLAFAKAKGYKTNDLKEIGRLIANEPKVKGTRVVVITQGPKNVLVAKTNDPKGIFSKFEIQALTGTQSEQLWQQSN